MTSDRYEELADSLLRMLAPAIDQVKREKFIKLNKDYTTRLLRRVAEEAQAEEPRCCADTIPPGCRTCRCGNDLASAREQVRRLRETLMRAKTDIYVLAYQGGTKATAELALQLIRAALAETEEKHA